jgi:hypothetical protein
MTDKDPTGVITGDIKKIAFTLYNDILKSNSVKESGFIFNLKAYYLNKTKEIVDELNQPKYTDSEKVIKLYIKYVMNLSQSYKEAGLFLVEWLGKNGDVIFDKYDKIEHIEEILTTSSLDLYKQFVIDICKNSTHRQIYFNLLETLFNNFLNNKDNYCFFEIDKTLMIEKMLFLSEIDSKNSLSRLWKVFLKLLTVYKEDKELEDDDDEVQKTIEGFMFINAKRINKMKTKYMKCDPFEIMLEKINGIYDVIVEADVVHQGVDKIIMSYL